MFCYRCREDKEPEAFAFKSVKAGKRQSFCRHCQSEWRKQHYNENKEKYVARSAESNKKLIERNRNHVLKYLSEHPCESCGERDPIVLEFDHIRGVKKTNISNMVSKAMSIRAINEEIAKCQVLCANCHRRKTSRELSWWSSSRLLDMGD